MKCDVESELRRACGDLRPGPATETSLLAALRHGPRDEAPAPRRWRLGSLAAAATLIALLGVVWMRGRGVPAAQPAAPGSGVVVRLGAGDAFDVLDPHGVALATGRLDGVDTESQIEALARLRVALSASVAETERLGGDFGRVVLALDPGATVGSMLWVLQEIARLGGSVVVEEGGGFSFPYEFPRGQGPESPDSSALRVDLRRIDGVTQVRMGEARLLFTLSAASDAAARAEAAQAIFAAVRTGLAEASEPTVELLAPPPSGYAVPVSDLLFVWRVLMEAGCRVLVVGRTTPRVK